MNFCLCSSPMSLISPWLAGWTDRLTNTYVSFDRAPLSLSLCDPPSSLRGYRARRLQVRHRRQIRHRRVRHRRVRRRHCLQELCAQTGVNGRGARATATTRRSLSQTASSQHGSLVLSAGVTTSTTTRQAAAPPRRLRREARSLDPLRHRPPRTWSRVIPCSVSSHARTWTPKGTLWTKG